MPIENVSFIFYFEAVNGEIVLAAQVKKNTEVSEYDDVFSQRYLRNEQCCTTQCEFNPGKGEHLVCEWCDIACRARETGSQGGDTTKSD